MDDSSSLFPHDLPDRFAACYGRFPEIIASAPGRVNLIGEHTDYNEGFVLPVAIDRRTWVALAGRTDDRLHFRSETTDDDVEIGLGDVDDHRQRGWSSYVAGIVSILRSQGVPVRGLDALFTSTVPVASGLSSSAALEVSMASGVLAMAGRSLPSRELARVCQRAEWDWAGVQCGIMDQTIAVSGRSRAALLIDCRSLETEAVPLDPHLQLIVCETGVPRSLAASEYNKRRNECEEAVRELGRTASGLSSLRDVTEEILSAHGGRLAETPLRRARHVVTENERVRHAVDALWLRDHRTLGTLLNASHASLRDDYQVSCSELDAMVDICQSVPGVCGARMTGAGFGGCALALADPEAVAPLTEAIMSRYPRRTGRTPTVVTCTVGDGARAVRVG
jgi:galactokinase